MGLRSDSRKFTSEFVEVTALRGNDSGSFRSGRLRGLQIAWQVEYGTRLNPVDVVALEYTWIGAQQGHQHLVERDIGRFQGQRNFAGCIAGTDLDLAPFDFARLSFAFVAAIAVACTVVGLRWARLGWRKQQGVVTHDPARGPTGFQQEVKKRIGDRALATEPNVEPAVGALLQRSL